MADVLSGETNYQQTRTDRTDDALAAWGDANAGAPAAPTTAPATPAAPSGQPGMEALPQIVEAVIHQESGGNPNAVSPKGATGLMQLMPDTAREMGYDPAQLSNPIVNRRAGTQYLMQQFNRFGNWHDALVAYNGGPAHVGNPASPPSADALAYADQVLKTAGQIPTSEQAGQRLSTLQSATTGAEFVARGINVIGGAAVLAGMGIPLPDAVAGGAILDKAQNIGADAAISAAHSLFGQGHPVVDAIAGILGGGAVAGGFTAPVAGAMARPAPGESLAGASQEETHPLTAMEGNQGTTIPEAAPQQTVPAVQPVSVPSGAPGAGAGGALASSTPAPLPAAGDVSHQMVEMTALARATPFTPEHVGALELSGSDEHALLRTPIDAVDNLRMHYYATDQVGEFMGNYAAGKAGDAQAAARATELATDLSQVTIPRWRAMRHQAGLGLRVLGSPADESTPLLSDVADIIAKSNGNADYMVKELGSLPTAAARQRYLNLAAGGGWSRFLDNAASYYSESLLSLETLATKGTTDAFVLAVSPFERQAGEWVGALRRALGADPATTTAPGETDAFMNAGVDALNDAIKVGAASIREGTSVRAGTGGFGEVLPPRTLSVQGTMFADSQIGRAIDLYFQFIHLPSRGIMGLNDAVETMHERMQLGALAYRRAYWETAASQDPEAFYKAYDGYRANPPPDMREAAQEYAKRQVLGQPMAIGGGKASFGNLAQGIQNLRVNSTMARILIPFWPTPVNLFRLTQSWGGPLALTSRAWWNMMNSGTGDADLALARAGLGSALMTVLAYHWLRGGIESNGPQNPENRKLWIAAGHQPYAIKYGDGQNMETGNLAMPFKDDIKTLVDGIEVLSHTNPSDAEGLGAALQMMVAQRLHDTTFFKNAADLVTGLNVSNEAAEKFRTQNDLQGQMSPEQAEAQEGLQSPGGPSAGQRAMWRMAGSVVPSTVAAIAHGIDPIQRQVNSAIDEIKSRTPFLSRTLPPERDLFGRVAEVPLGWNRYTGNLISLFRTTKVTHDPVVDELNKVQPVIPTFGQDGMLAVGQPGAMEKVPATPQQIDQVSRLRGQYRDPDTGYNLHDHLAALIKTPEYRAKALPDQQKDFTAAASAFTNVARNLVMQGDPRADPKSLVNVDDDIKRTILSGGDHDMQQQYLTRRKARIALHTPANGLSAP